MSALVFSLWLAMSGADGGFHRAPQDVKLLYFHAAWCRSCARLDASDVLKDLPVKVEPVDVDANEALVEKYGVQHTPDLVLVTVAEGFPLGRPTITLDDPATTRARLDKLIKKMTK